MPKVWTVFPYPNNTKLKSGWGNAPDPTGGASSAPPVPFAVTGGARPLPHWHEILISPPPPGSATACQLAWLAADCIIEKRNIHLTFLYEMNFMY